MAGTLEAQNKSMILNGPVYTMDRDRPYQAIRIENGVVAQLYDQPVSGAPSVNPGQVIYPGFIDTHSHAISLFSAQTKGPDNRPNWISLANVNVMGLPPCADLGSTTCFAPVTEQSQVEMLMRRPQTNSAGWKLGWNYEPTRMVCGPGTKNQRQYGFQCPNFENMQPGDVLKTLDAWGGGAPVMITSESGHIVYVNNAALKQLNICSSSNQDPSCHQPTSDALWEMKIAEKGQLDEDLALYAIGFVEGKLAEQWGLAVSSDPKSPAYQKAVMKFYSDMIRNSLAAYSRFGYTTVQEGAAAAGVIDLYMATALEKPLPVTMAFLEYDDSTYCDIGGSVRKALAKQKALRDGKFDMFVAGMKVYSDGSTQGYTGDMGPTVPYKNVPPIFTWASDGTPYQGRADYGIEALTEAATAAHRGGLPLWVHTNGRRANANVVDVLTKTKTAGLRDVIVHFAMPTEANVQSAAAAGIGATFLINDYYYFYQTVCEQVVDDVRAAWDLYPAAWAKKYGMPFGIHSDATVTPPDPMFGMWVATQRPIEEPEWLPRLPGNACNVPSPQVIDIKQALRAYTSDAAWLYGRDVATAAGPAIGTLRIGNAGDFVVLSEDPLQAADVRNVKVVMTVHNGDTVYPVPPTAQKATAKKKKKGAG